MSSKRPFVVETFNAHDRAAPQRAHFIYVTERPPRATLERELGYFMILYPPRGTDAMLWDRDRFEVEGTDVIDAWKSGREHGKPGTTPHGYIESWWGYDRETGEQVAFVGGHLVNNAFGPSTRGERVLRLMLWRQGWKAMRKEAKRLRGHGCTVIKLGDFNRRPRYWPHILDRSIGRGYDRIVYPAAVELQRAWTGPANGSDHRPLFGEFVWRAMASS